MDSILRNLLMGLVPTILMACGQTAEVGNGIQMDGGGQILLDAGPNYFSPSSSTDGEESDLEDETSMGTDSLQNDTDTSSSSTDLDTSTTDENQNGTTTDTNNATNTQKGRWVPSFIYTQAETVEEGIATCSQAPKALVGSTCDPTSKTTSCLYKGPIRKFLFRCLGAGLRWNLMDRDLTTPATAPIPKGFIECSSEKTTGFRSGGTCTAAIPKCITGNRRIRYVCVNPGSRWYVYNLPIDADYLMTNDYPACVAPNGTEYKLGGACPTPGSICMQNDRKRALVCIDRQ